MEKIRIPDGHQQVMPYLIVKDASSFLLFMQRVFGAKEKIRKMRDEKTIMHAEIFIGGSVIMFCDSTGDFKAQPGSLFIYVHDADSTYNSALAEGATPVMEPSDQDYGRSCGITDPCGNVWWITSVK